MKNKTAVQWLVDQLLNEDEFEFHKLVIDLAEAMEKEQIEKAFKDGIDKGFYIGGGSK